MNPTKLTNEVYDILKYVAQIFLPALGTFVAALGPVWGLPRVDEIVKTIVAIDTFIGALLLVSSVQYKKVKENTP